MVGQRVRVWDEGQQRYRTGAVEHCNPLQLTHTVSKISNLLFEVSCRAKRAVGNSGLEAAYRTSDRFVSLASALGTEHPAGDGAKGVCGRYDSRGSKRLRFGAERVKAARHDEL
jgi:hypothetical protein